MIQLALFARLEAKPGRESEVVALLEAGLALANHEASTPVWFALRLSPTTFGIFDAFEDEGGRQAHLNGPIAAALLAQAPELLVAPPRIERMEVLGMKNVAPGDGKPCAKGPVERREFGIREAHPGEFEGLGQLMVSVYSNLDGFPKKHEQPNYYEMLANIGRFAQKPATKLLVAVAENEVLGGIVYFSDMAQYGSGGTAIREQNASGFRLLAVDPEARGMGVGKALVEKCIELAKERGHGHVLIHSTKAMKVAWKMYEDRGFERSPDLDFMQGELQVFGFRLKLSSPGKG